MEEIKKEPYEFTSCIGKRKKSKNTLEIDKEIFKMSQVEKLREINDIANVTRYLIEKENADTSQNI